jgi:hypothetical protein
LPPQRPIRSDAPTRTPIVSWSIAIDVAEVDHDVEVALTVDEIGEELTDHPRRLGGERAHGA